MNALAFFTDPATGAPRLACACASGRRFVFDPVAGGEALVVIDVDEDDVDALEGLHGPGEVR